MTMQWNKSLRLSSVRNSTGNDIQLCQALGTRCSSVLRAFAHGAMGHRINPSWWNH